jgi:hypothetical protein
MSFQSHEELVERGIVPQSTFVELEREMENYEKRSA